MVFSSLAFLYVFLPLITVLYFVWNNRIYRNIVLLAFSVFFYAWGEPKYIIVMLLSVFCAYVGGLLIEYFKKREKKGLSLAVTLLTTAVLVGFLLVFKYLNLFVDTFNSIFSTGISMTSAISSAEGS